MRRPARFAIALSLVLPGAVGLAGEAAAPAAGSPAPQAQAISTGAHLGVMVEALPDALAAQLPPSVPQGQGVLIGRVEVSSPAEAAGLKPYDLLLSYDDQKLFSPEQLSRLVAADQPGRSVTLRLVRGGQVQVAEATLGQGAARPRTSQAWQAQPFHWPRHAVPGTPDQWQETVKESFQSLEVKKLRNDHYRVAIAYLDADGKMRSYVFEGTREELRQQIGQSKELPAAARRHLLNALNMQGGWPMLHFPVPLDFEELMRIWRQGGCLQY